MLHASPARQLLFLFLITTVLLLGCGGQTKDTTSPDIKLTVLSDSFVPGGEATVTSDITENEGRIRVDLVTTDATDLKALYCTLEYDPALLHPVSADVTGVLSGGRTDASHLVQLSVLREAGTVHHGQVLANWQNKSGYTGAGTLATVYFARGPVRQTAAPPIDASSKPQLTYDSATQILSWRHANRGDYDQNGLVNISDLTPLGANLGQFGPFAYSTALSVIDGDGNGAINISDLTPLGASLGRRVDGYYIVRSSTIADYPATPGGPNGPGAVAFADAHVISDIAGPGARRLYMFTLIAPTTGDVYWVRSHDPSGEGISSDPITAIGNNPPTAHLVATPGFGTVPLSVVFDPSTSSDSDGTIDLYEFDWEGDGVYDYSTTSSAAVGYDYLVAGSYTATLRVTDDGGATALDFEVVQVNPLVPATWHVITISGPGAGNDVGRFNDVEDIGGFPALTWTDDDADVLYYVRATDAVATSWSPWQQVGLTSGVGNPFVAESADVGLVEVSGVPAVAYYQNGDLYFARADDVLGTFWTPTMLDAGSGHDLSLAVINGNPAIVYSDVGGGSNMRYLRADSGDGSSWTDPEVSFGAPGRNFFLTEINSRPMISLQDQTDDHLWFYWSTHPSGIPGTWNFVEPTVDIPTGSSNSWLAEVNGLPALVFSKPSPGLAQMAYIRATDATYLTWTAPFDPVAVAGSHGGFPAMAIVGGFPAISSWHSGNGALQYVRATEVNGASWSPPETVDEPAAAEVGSHTHMTVIGGNPVISYYDQTNGDLKLAILY